MKTIETSKLKIGDWILEGEGIKGKFKIAKVVAYRIKEWTEFDLDVGEIKYFGACAIKEGVGGVRVLNDKEIKRIKILKNKIIIAKNLQDNKVIEKEEWTYPI